MVNEKSNGHRFPHMRDQQSTNFRACEKGPSPGNSKAVIGLLYLFYQRNLLSAKWSD